MHGLSKRAVAAAFLASVFLLGSASVGSAQESNADYPITSGHFYRQAAGGSARDGHGFRITDEDGIPFFNEFSRLGGVETLGYPISRRFYLDGFVCQATQRAILQWHPGERRVRLINVMEYLSRLGADPQLREARLVPPPAAVDSEDLRDIWLNMNPRIKTVYFGAADPLAVFGLPLSPAQEMGHAVAMRFQRGVIYDWQTPQPWTGSGTVSVGNAGDFVKEARGIPAAALEPEPAPPIREVVRPARAAVREGSRIAGVATWYGAYFQGSPMANGQPFDMWDRTTTASNSHPLGTRLRVTRVATGESIVVRVTDRGAFRSPIVVDLSYAAFRSLADPDDGVIRVVVDTIE